MPPRKSQKLHKGCFQIYFTFQQRDQSRITFANAALAERKLIYDPCFRVISQMWLHSHPLQLASESKKGKKKAWSQWIID